MQLVPRSPHCRRKCNRYLILFQRTVDNLFVGGRCQPADGIRLAVFGFIDSAFPERRRFYVNVIFARIRKSVIVDKRLSPYCRCMYDFAVFLNLKLIPRAPRHLVPPDHAVTETDNGTAQNVDRHFV